MLRRKHRKLLFGDVLNTCLEAIVVLLAPLSNVSTVSSLSRARPLPKKIISVLNAAHEG